MDPLRRNSSDSENSECPPVNPNEPLNLSTRSIRESDNPSTSYSSGASNLLVDNVLSQLEIEEYENNLILEAIYSDANISQRTEENLPYSERTQEGLKCKDTGGNRFYDTPKISDSEFLQQFEKYLPPIEASDESLEEYMKVNRLFDAFIRSNVECLQEYPQQTIINLPSSEEPQKSIESKIIEEANFYFGSPATSTAEEVPPPPEWSQETLYNMSDDNLDHLYFYEDDTFAFDEEYSKKNDEYLLSSGKPQEGHENKDTDKTNRFSDEPLSSVADYHQQSEEYLPFSEMPEGSLEHKDMEVNISLDELVRSDEQQRQQSPISDISLTEITRNLKYHNDHRSRIPQHTKEYFRFSETLQKRLQNFDCRSSSNPNLDRLQKSTSIKVANQDNNLNSLIQRQIYYEQILNKARLKSSVLRVNTGTENKSSNKCQTYQEIISKDCQESTYNASYENIGTTTSSNPINIAQLDNDNILNLASIQATSKKAATAVDNQYHPASEDPNPVHSVETSILNEVKIESNLSDVSPSLNVDHSERIWKTAVAAGTQRARCIFPKPCERNVLLHTNLSQLPDKTIDPSSDTQVVTFQPLDQSRLTQPTSSSRVIRIYSRPGSSSKEIMLSSAKEYGQSNVSRKAIEKEHLLQESMKTSQELFTRETKHEFDRDTIQAKSPTKVKHLEKEFLPASLSGKENIPSPTKGSRQSAMKRKNLEENDSPLPTWEDMQRRIHADEMPHILAMERLERPSSERKKQKSEKQTLRRSSSERLLSSRSLNWDIVDKENPSTDKEKF